MPGSPPSPSPSLRESEQAKHTACLTGRKVGGGGVGGSKVIFTRRRYICEPNPTCKNTHPLLLRYLTAECPSALYKLNHPRGEMTPVHLIPRIISRLHSCWFSASARAAGIGVIGSALLQHSFNSVSFHTLTTEAKERFRFLQNTPKEPV